MIKRIKLSDSIVEYLMDKFVKKEFKPGDKIIETKIADQLNVSQGGVREAISTLISMGFLESKPFKWTGFKKFTIKDIVDYQEIRAELEAAALKMAIKNFNYKNIDIAYLQDVTNKMLDGVKTNDYGKRTLYDIKFHQHLVKASNNKSLDIAWNSLGHYYWAYVWLYLDVEPLQKRTIKHNLICESLEKRDYKMSIRLIKEHFFELEKLLLKRKDLKRFNQGHVSDLLEK